MAGRLEGAASCHHSALGARHQGRRTALANDLTFDDIGAKRRDLDDSDMAGDPESLAADLEALGPTFIKLGQALSMRPDVVPAP